MSFTITEILLPSATVNRYVNIEYFNIGFRGRIPLIYVKTVHIQLISAHSCVSIMKQ